MDLRKLEIFACVAHLNSFSQAAETLHMAQPAVSIAVRKLEEELDTQLLERQNRRIRLTTEGREVLQRAELILAQVDELKDSVSDLNELLCGELNITCPSMLATYYFPDLLGRFLTQHTGLTASITQAGTKKIESMLMDNQIELGVITVQNPHEDLELIPLIKEHIVLCVGNNHPLQARKHIRIEELHKSPMILYEQDYFIRQTLDERCKQGHVSPDIRMQTNFLPLITRMVKQNLGATIGLSMMAEQEPGIHSIDIRPRIEMQMAIARRRGRSISRANQAFLNWLTAQP